MGKPGKNNLDKVVIVESPAKARTIGKILGNDFKIFASIGHIRDLPERSLGVDLEHDFAPQYEVNKDKTKVVKQLQAAVKDAGEVWLAPDPDREGEAIAWHLKALLEKHTKGDFKRVTFHEITRGAINKAFQSPTELNMHLVDSQQARRILDRIVGYMTSPLLWSKVERGISAGRVQSVALRLVCEREREILAFVPKEYWEFFVDFEAFSKGSGKVYAGKLAKIDGEKAEIPSAEVAKKASDALAKVQSYTVGSVETKPRQKHAPPPHITSTMQQEASIMHGYPATMTMKLAQQLYEGIELGSGGPVGLITYMRTDSFNVARDAQEACLSFIKDSYGPEYAPAQPNFYKSRDSAQGAHEAIRPTDVTLTPEKARQFLDDKQLRLYTMIWKRFVSSQMASAQQLQTSVDTNAEGADGRTYTFRTSATVTTFPGYKKIYDVEKEEDESQKGPSVLAELKSGTVCFPKNLKNEQKFTEPPPRYSEASLIKELESNGIGRPSTYASILSTIQGREYVNKEKGRLIPTELGFKVTDYLVGALPELFEVGFTADMESKLDKIEEGQEKWTDMLHHFYDGFSMWVSDAKDMGAPEPEKVKALTKAMDNIKTWEPPEKRGGRSFNDEKLYKSIRDKFLAGTKASSNQWAALLSMAVKYKSQATGLEAAAEKAGFADELAAMTAKVEAAKEKRESSAASGEQKSKYEEIFARFKEVKWEEPSKKGGRSYDDKKFFTSLKNQAESGKQLSEKQMAVIKRMAVKYKEQIQDFASLSELLGVGAEEAEAAARQDPAVAAEIKGMLDKLAKVTAWAEPAKKGRRVYDDKTFFESLSKQFESGKQLSDRQVAALKKLAEKY